MRRGKHSCKLRITGKHLFSSIGDGICRIEHVVARKNQIHLPHLVLVPYFPALHLRVFPYSSELLFSSISSYGPVSVGG